MFEEKKAEIALKTECRKNSPIICKDKKHLLKFLTFRLPSILFAARGEGGPQTKWKASGRFPFIWLRRRRRPQYTVQIVVFVGGPLLETIMTTKKPFLMGVGNI